MFFRCLKLRPEGWFKWLLWKVEILIGLTVERPTYSGAVTEFSRRAIADIVEPDLHRDSLLTQWTC